MNGKQAKDRIETAERLRATGDTTSPKAIPEGKPLSEQDLDAVAGGAARRGGPGTQTEDDAFVG